VISILDGILTDFGRSHLSKFATPVTGYFPNLSLTITKSNDEIIIFNALAIRPGDKIVALRSIRN
jgi:hypothetical protein